MISGRIGPLGGYFMPGMKYPGKRMRGAHMATKTIAVDLAASDRLTSARASAKESFSSVIRRADWPASCTSGSDLLDLMDYLPPLPSGIIDELEAAQKQDNPPADKWH
jgi:hypothetical protein